MPVIVEGGGGGGTGAPPVLIVTPASPYNLGTQVAGSALTGNIHVRSSKYTVSWDVTGNTGSANFTVGPPVSGVANTTGTNIPITINKPVGVYSTTITITDLDNAVNHTIVVTATFVAAGSTLLANIANVLFPPNVLGSAPAQQIVQISNNTGGSVTITEIDVAGLTFKCLTAAPITIANGASANVTLQTDYSVVGTLTGTVTFKSALSDLVVPLNVVVSFVNSVDVLQNLTRVILMAFDQLTQKFDGTNFDPALDCTLVFNGSIWNSPGNEKVLRRVLVFYENVGICTGLKLDAQSWRPSLQPPTYDHSVKVITIGDQSADGSERSAFVDVEMAGEIIVIQLTRLASTGPVSLIGFIPQLEDKGEKVDQT